MRNTRFWAGSVLGVGALSLASAALAQIVCARPAAQAHREAGLPREGLRTITVLGEGTARASPNVALADIGVTVQGVTVTGATNEARVVTNGVIMALRARGLAERDIHTQRSGIWPEAQPVAAERPSPPGEVAYRVSSRVLVTIRDLDRMGEVLDAAVEAGANQMYGVTFTVSDPAAGQSEARRHALADATARAHEVAALYGVQLGEMVSVSEVTGGWNSPIAGASGRVATRGTAGAEGGGSPALPSEVKLSTQLQVVYGIRERT
jgi:uncharacterized protein YggE